jgi:hypothetical protein
MSAAKPFCGIARAACCCSLPSLGPAKNTAICSNISCSVVSNKSSRKVESKGTQMPHLHMKKYVSVAAIGLRIVESSGGSDTEKPACEFWSREQLNKFGMKRRDRGYALLVVVERLTTFRGNITPWIKNFRRRGRQCGVQHGWYKCCNNA